MKYDVKLRLRNSAAKVEEIMEPVDAETGDQAANMARMKYLPKFKRVTVHGVYPARLVKPEVAPEASRRLGLPRKPH